MGLQKDGDLLQQAWNAVVQRGPSNQSLRKVKGHTTKEDIQKGISKEGDKEGNERSDENADKRVIKIAGEGLVRLGAWVAGRHDKYIALMKRIQNMIAAVLKEEKEERSKREKVRKVALGYDPKKMDQSKSGHKRRKARIHHLHGPQHPTAGNG